MKKYFLLLFAVFITVNATAQQTPFEIKKYQLAVDLFKKLEVDEYYLKNVNDLNGVEALFLTGIVISRLSTEKGISLLLQYNRDLKSAESLKSAVDIQREKQKKENEMRDALKRQEEFERKRKENEKKEKYQNSDIAILKGIVTEKTRNWLTKGEFEKNEDYEKRIKYSTNENFARINYEAICNRTDYYIRNRPHFQLGTYDADNEYFKISISFNDIKWNQNISIPLSEAPTFKENFDFNNCEINFIGWGVYDNNLYPTKIILLSKSFSYEFITPVNKLVDYRVRISSLGLSNIHLSDAEFSLNNYQEKLNAEKEKLIENEKKDQIRLEEERRKQEKQEQLEKSDFGKILAEIRTEFKEWEKKTEYESELEYSTRLQNKRKEELTNISKKIISNYNQLNNSLVKDNLCVLGEIKSYDSETNSFTIKPTLFNSDNGSYISVSSTYNKNLSNEYNSLISNSKFDLPISSRLAREIQNRKDQIQIRIVPQKYIIYDNNFKISEAYIILSVKGYGDIDNHFDKFTVSENQITIEDGTYGGNDEKQSTEIPLLSILKRKSKNLKIRKLEILNNLENNFKQTGKLTTGVYYNFWKFENDINYKKELARDLSISDK